MFSQDVFDELPHVPAEQPDEEMGEATLQRDSHPQEEEISQEDAWAVITSFFEEKGLVRQQLDSFNEFVSNTMQEIIDEGSEIRITPENQLNPGGQEEGADKEYKIKFGQIYLSKPLVTEHDEDTDTLFPREARLRNLT
jgi:DNA-directed RNA polymerase II subunit RPB2